MTKPRADLHSWQLHNCSVALLGHPRVHPLILAGQRRTFTRKGPAFSGSLFNIMRCALNTHSVEPKHSKALK